jgi:mechanosensitive ion channel-like protein
VLAIDFQQGWNDAWQRIATFLPKFVAFLLILILGYIVAKVLAKVVNGVLERVGFDRWVERGGLRDMLARSRYDASDILAKIVFWAVMLLVLQLAFGVFGSNPVSDLLRGIIAYLPNIFVAIIILVIAAALARAAADILGTMLAGVSGGAWMARGAGAAILVIGIFAALDQLMIAPAIVTGLFYAMLAIIVGSAIVAVGGGGIRTMQRYWERTSGKLEKKGPEVRREVQGRDVQPESSQTQGLVHLTERERQRR